LLSFRDTFGFSKQDDSPYNYSRVARFYCMYRIRNDIVSFLFSFQNMEEKLCSVMWNALPWLSVIKRFCQSDGETLINRVGHT
jgi:hypothetical protein